MLNRKSQFLIYNFDKIYYGILRKIETQRLNLFPGRGYGSQPQKGIFAAEFIRTRFVPNNIQFHQINQTKNNMLNNVIRGVKWIFYTKLV